MNIITVNEPQPQLVKLLMMHIIFYTVGCNMADGRACQLSLNYLGVIIILSIPFASSIIFATIIIYGYYNNNYDCMVETDYKCHNNY